MNLQSFSPNFPSIRHYPAEPVESTRTAAVIREEAAQQLEARARTHDAAARRFKGNGDFNLWAWASSHASDLRRKAHNIRQNT